VSESILVADDSLLVREAIQNALRQRGASVELASDGAQAHSRLRDLAPDLLIADVHMPGLDGYALCREAKTERSATRVLLLVGTFEPFDGNAASAALADGVLRKPFVAEELLRKVEELLGPVRRAPPAPVTAAPSDSSFDTASGSVVSAPPEVEAPEAVDSGERRLELTDAEVDRVARRVLELGGGAVLERVAREILEARSRRGDPEPD
jgi:CheY-like chemotaxis protein